MKRHELEDLLAARDERAAARDDADYRSFARSCNFLMAVLFIIALIALLATS